MEIGNKWNINSLTPLVTMLSYNSSKEFAMCARKTAKPFKAFMSSAQNCNGRYWKSHCKPYHEWSMVSNRAFSNRNTPNVKNKPSAMFIHPFLYGRTISHSLSNSFSRVCLQDVVTHLALVEFGENWDLIDLACVTMICNVMYLWIDLHRHRQACMVIYMSVV